MNVAFVKLEMLREKSRTLHIQMDALLGGYVTQQLALWIRTVDQDHHLLLKNAKDLDLGAYRRRVYGKLLYALVDQTQTVQTILEQVKALAQQEGLRLSYEIQTDSDSMTVQVQARLGDRNIPVCLQIHPAQTDRQPGEKTIHLILENSRAEKLLVYPYEQQIYEGYVSLLENLTLLQDMSVLENIYVGLENVILEGRSVAKELGRMEECFALELNQQRYEQFLSCADNPYLKKRWKSYRKKQALDQPDFEQLMSRIISFLQPVWKERLEGMVYLGSWLPELGRYLD